MRDAKVSSTAVKVAHIILALSQHETWRARLPRDIGEQTQHLLRATGGAAGSRRVLELAKHPWMHRLSLRVERWSPGTYEGIGWRKIFMEDAVVRAVNDGIKQVVVVGAGFDTLCLRLAPAHSGARFVEIDHPATSVVKRHAVEKIGRPNNLEFVPADLSKVPLSEAVLSSGGWDVSARAVAVVEGVFMYLTEAQVTGVFDHISRCASTGSRVAFSHLRSLEESGRMSRLLLRFMGEPWLSSKTRDELDSWLNPLGWDVIDRDHPRSDRDLEVFAVAQSRSERS